MSSLCIPYIRVEGLNFSAASVRDTSTPKMQDTTLLPSIEAQYSAGYTISSHIGNLVAFSKFLLSKVYHLDYLGEIWCPPTLNFTFDKGNSGCRGALYSKMTRCWGTISFPCVRRENLVWGYTKFSL